MRELVVQVMLLRGCEWIRYEDDVNLQQIDLMQGGGQTSNFTKMSIIHLGVEIFRPERSGCASIH